MTIGNAAYILIFLSACIPSLSEYFYMSYRQIVGGLYPAYLAYKALKRRDGPEITRLVMYFIVFQIFCSVEFYLDLFLAFWLPFYYESKLIFIYWLISPYGNGAQILYENLISKKFEQHEQNIDKQIGNLRQFAIDSTWHLLAKFNCCLNRLLVLAIAKAQMAAIQYVHAQQNLMKKPEPIQDEMAETDAGPLIEMMETDNDETDQSLSIKSKQDQEQDEQEGQVVQTKKPLRKTKRKRRITIEDISSLFVATEQNHNGPVTRSQAANRQTTIDNM
nr:receptor expression-enhancing protein 1-like isoform X1 [Dermatophagoides farinae]